MQVDYEKYKFLDVGNTSVVLKKFNGTDFYGTRRFLTKYFKAELLLQHLEKEDALFISCVVDELSISIKTILGENGIKARFITKSDAYFVDFSKRDGEMGADMVAQIEGAAFLYPSSSFCVVSMGTAITITVVDKQRVFQGGMIAADYRLQLESLYNGTSKLPALSPHIPQELYGQYLFVDSQKAIKSGTYHLIYFGIHGILGQLKKEYPDLVILGTGGFGHYFKDLFDTYHENLLFLGLQKVLLENRD